MKTKNITHGGTKAAVTQAVFVFQDDAERSVDHHE